MKEYILSVDASLSSTGWAVIEKGSKDVIDLGRICTKSTTPEDDRIQYIIDTLLEIRDKYSIREAVLEDGYLGKNAKTAMQLSKLRGGIIFVLRTYDTSVVYMQPSIIRQIFVGKGNASKEEVAEAITNMYSNNIHVQALWPFSDKNNKSKNSDMYDAVSIGVSHLMKQEQEQQCPVQTA
jgi:crossover junction endodeoxyribonuclease RuvC